MAISIMVKPCGGLCNIACKYCFYSPISTTSKFMSQDFAKNLIDKIFEYEKKSVTFIFQGGEPTLIGLPFYEFFVTYVQQKKENRIISYSFQTNGILLNKNFAKFLAKNKFLIGVSLDGDKYINDKNRLKITGKSTYLDVINSLRLLKDYGVEFNILAVISKQSVLHAKKIYEFFKKSGYKFLQFTIPVSFGVDAELPTPKEMTAFLCDLFDLYYKDFISGNYVSIRYFDNLVHLIKYNRCEQCGLSGNCGLNIVIDSELNCYPCDFFASSENLLGNLNDIDFASVISNANTFLKQVSTPKECLACDVFPLCNNGCKRYHTNGLNYYCEAYKIFLTYAKEKLIKIGSKIN